MFFQKRSYVTTYDRDRFGRKGRGFVPPTSPERPRTVNVKDVEALAIKHKVKEIDVAQFGYGKVLGAGKITIPLSVKAKVITEKAKAKIEKAGGKAISEQKEEAE
jgi:large subunit ribosomal protein L15